MSHYLPIDVVWLVLQWLPCNEIIMSRGVCLTWKLTVDRLTDDDWRSLFCARVCSSLCVREDFDWKVAAVRAALPRRESIAATCTWHNVHVRIRTPWVSTGGIDAPLSPGVRRCVNVTHNSHIIDYIYDEIFRLRGIGRTCVQQFTTECSNCSSKRQCLFMRYTYYLRPLHAVTTSLDESLSRRLTSRSGYESLQTENEHASQTNYSHD